MRKEWRQYAVILAMLTAGVTAAVAGVLVAHNMTSPNETEYGNGQLAATTTNPEALGQALDRAAIEYGVVHRATLQRDGHVGTVELVAANPTNTVVEPLFALRDGRWPDSAAEVAVTDRALADRPPIGSSVTLDGQTVRIVGVIENPTRLSDEFVFAAVPTIFESANAAGATRFLVDASEPELSSAFSGGLGVESTDGPPNRTFATILVNVIVAFGMLEVALLVGSAFAVIARRRTRQYGLLAATGASPSTVRSAAASSGAIVGLIGTSAGLVLGLLIARGLVEAMESTVDHRISFEYPLLGLVPSIVLGVAVATIAARRPASTLKRSSVASLLSATRPRREPVGRSALFGLALAGAGAVSLIRGFQNQQISFALIGAVLTPVGLLMLAPVLVQLVGKLASRLPLPERLAGRSIARYNRRSAAMVAALALAVSVPIGIAVVTTSIDQRAEDRPPNLADNQLIVWAPDMDSTRPVVPATVDQEAFASAIEVLTDAAPDLSFAPLQVMVANPEEGYTEDGVAYDLVPAAGQRFDGALCNFCSVDVMGFDDGDEYIASFALMATPALLDTLGLETNWLTEGKLALASEPGLSLLEPGVLAEGDAVAISESWPTSGSFPKLLYSPDVAVGATARTMGWLATNDGPIDEATLAAIGAANLSGVDLELPTSPASRSSLRAIGLVIGALVGLGITAAAAVLLTSELARDSALLASLGASPRTGRRMSSAIAGLVALGGTTLGVVIGYVPLAPLISSTADNFPFVVPWASLVVVLVVVPLVAGGLGQFLSRRAAAGLDLRDFA